MKRMVLYLLIFLIAMCFIACNSPNYLSTENQVFNDNSSVFVQMSVSYMTYEEALLLSTHVVVAQYLGHRNFGESAIEFEFYVLERVLGDSADRIFVYAMNTYSSTMGCERSIHFNNSDLSFNVGGQYLLVLRRIWAPHTKVNEDGYRLIRNLVVDLDNPQNSIMYNEPLYLHSELDFNRGRFSREQIVDHAREITRNNLPAIEYIRSSNVTEVVEESDYILLVEVNEFRSMARTDLQHTDIFYCTVVQVLQGDLEPGFELLMVFLADTVQPGEQHIIAVRRVEEGSHMFVFTSRNSMFEPTQFDEIMAVLKQQQ